MSESTKPAVGSIIWVDLTVDDAEELREFYAAVTGWKSEPVPMNGYNDWNMADPATGTPVAGVCNARGVNAELPPQWIIYVAVADLDASLAACRAGGGVVISGPRDMGDQGRFAVIRDPAGAATGLMEMRG